MELCGGLPAFGELEKGYREGHLAVVERAEDLGKRVRVAKEAFERAADVCEDLRGIVKSMDGRLGKAEESGVVVEDTYERREKIEEAYVVVSKLCEEVMDRVERLSQNALDKEGFDHVVNKRLHDLEVE